MRHYKLIPPRNHNAQPSCWRSLGQCTRNLGQDYSLRQHLDGASSKPLVAHSTNPLFCYQNTSVSSSITSTQLISKSQLYLFRVIKALPKRSNDPALVNDCVRSSHSRCEVRLQLVDCENIRNQFQRR